MRFPKLFKRTSVPLPTFSGWILLSGIVAFVFTVFLLNIHPFLSESDPSGGDLLVVEGWLPDYALEKAAGIFLSGHYRMVITTGGPLDQGSYLIEYKTYAGVAYNSLKAIGLADSIILPIPSEGVNKDRTYQAAVAFRGWLVSSGKEFSSIDVVSLGAHTRRSALLYKKVLGSQIRVGKIAVENESYDSRKWWNSSEGVKSVVSEVVSGIYTFFFISSK